MKEIERRNVGVLEIPYLLFWIVVVISLFAQAIFTLVFFAFFFVFSTLTSKTTIEFSKFVVFAENQTIIIIFTYLLLYFLLVYIFRRRFFVQTDDYQIKYILGLKTVFISFMLSIAIYLLSKEIITQINGNSGFKTPYDNLYFQTNIINVFLLLFLSVCVIAPLFEEFFYRKIIISILKENQATNLEALTISTFLFTLSHLLSDLLFGNFNYFVVHSIFVIIMGLYLGALYLIHRSYFVNVVAHSAINFALWLDLLNQKLKLIGFTVMTSNNNLKPLTLVLTLSFVGIIFFQLLLRLEIKTNAIKRDFMRKRIRYLTWKSLSTFLLFTVPFYISFVFTPQFMAQSETSLFSTLSALLTQLGIILIYLTLFINSIEKLKNSRFFKEFLC